MRFLIPQPWILSLKINNSYTRYEIHAGFEGGATDCALWAGARPLCAPVANLLGVVTSCCYSPHIPLTSSPLTHPPPYSGLWAIRMEGDAEKKEAAYDRLEADDVILRDGSKYGSLLGREKVPRRLAGIPRSSQQVLRGGGAFFRLPAGRLFLFLLINKRENSSAAEKQNKKTCAHRLLRIILRAGANANSSGLRVNIPR